MQEGAFYAATAIVGSKARLAHDCDGGLARGRPCALGESLTSWRKPQKHGAPAGASRDDERVTAGSASKKARDHTQVAHHEVGAGMELRTLPSAPGLSEMSGTSPIRLRS